MNVQMLNIISRDKYSDEVLALFSSLGIKGYTVISGAGGSGETGAVSGTHGWADRNTMFLVALDDDHMPALVKAVRELHARLVGEHHGREIPLKVFLYPCEVIV